MDYWIELLVTASPCRLTASPTGRQEKKDGLLFRSMLYMAIAAVLATAYSDSHPHHGSIVNGCSNGTGHRRVQIISRRVVVPDPLPALTSSAPETIHLTPWDLRMLSLDYIQKGVLLPKPNHHHHHHHAAAPLVVIDHLASALARALTRFHPFAGRLVAIDERDGDGKIPTISVALRCTGEGAELVHAAAPGVTAADIAGALYIPRDVVASMFPLNGLASADAAVSEDGGSRRAPLLAAQVTELADAVFVAVSLNHAVGDGTTFWHFFNTWSDLSRQSSGGAHGDDEHHHHHPPLPVLERWFHDTCPVPVRLPFARLELAVRRCDRRTPLHECFFHFSAESVRKLKARANAEAHSSSDVTVVISSLQALLAHLWRAVCRARRLEPSQETAYVLLIGCRGRVKGVPAAGYVGNAVVPCKVWSTAGEVTAGLGTAARLLNRAVASLVDDQKAMVRSSVERWAREPRLAYNADMLTVAAVGTGSSPRFDVYGNDFGWGKPFAVRSGPGNKMDGKTSVFEGRGGGGAMALEVCLAPDTLERLAADGEFMDAVTVP
ncbi:hypothetical protein HU200_008026 [Digitaria exilis]|uniref:Uncharacterized protein n=1 Tax=Digitaria exilis TaxID=1010633 RepID=A0A835FMG8_9POAL|nr:hypothetical protein HU200_008026 [Digitaria exilis]